jgi:hypothetical protein
MYGRERDIFHAKSLEETQRLMHAAVRMEFRVQLSGVGFKFQGPGVIF